MDFEIVLNIDPKKIKLGDVIALQEGDLKAARSFVMSCMVDKDGQPFEKDKALELLNDVTIDEFQQLLSKVMEGMNKNPLPLSGDK